MDSIAVTLGGRLLHGRLPNGDRHKIEAIEGWWGSPNVKHSTLSPSSGDGVVITESDYEGRPLVIRGKSHPGPGRTGYDAASWLGDRFDLVKTGALLVVGEPGTPQDSSSAGGPKQAVVRKEGRSRIRPRPNGVEWEIPLIAPDPRKYSTVLVKQTISVEGGEEADSELVTNLGNYPTFPEWIRIWGSGAQPIRLLRVVPEDQTQNHGWWLEKNPVGANEYLIRPRTEEVFYGVPTTQEGIADGSTAGLVSSYSLADPRTRPFLLPGDGQTVRLRLRRSNAILAAIKATVAYRHAWVT